MKKTNQVRQVAFPIISALIWGTAFVAQDVVADKMDAFTFNALRSAVAVVVLQIIIRIFDHFNKDKPRRTEEEKRFDRKQLIWGGIWCGLFLGVASNFQQAGIGAGTDAGKAGFITALYVVLVPVLGLFFKRKASLPVWIAVALSVLALYLLCIKGDFTLAPGDLLILCCAVVFSGHILVIDHYTATVDGIKLSCAQFFVCGVLSAIGMLFFSHPDWPAIWQCALPVLYVGVFSSGVAYTLQILAQKGSNPTVVTILLSLESVFAVLAGAVILHQKMTPREYVGCILMFIAVILAQLEFPIKKKAIQE